MFDTADPDKFLGVVDSSRILNATMQELARDDVLPTIRRTVVSHEHLQEFAAKWRELGEKGDSFEGRTCLGALAGWGGDTAHSYAPEVESVLNLIKGRLLGENVQRVYLHGGPFRKVTGVVSPIDVLDLVYKLGQASPVPFSDFGGLQSATIRELNLMTRCDASVEVGTTAAEAFNSMFCYNQLFLPVVDKAGALASCISASDLRCMTPVGFSKLMSPVEDFTRLHSPARKGEGPVSVTLDSEFLSLLDIIVKHRVHQVFVVDADKKPLGVIRLVDVLRRMTLTKEDFVAIEAAEQALFDRISSSGGGGQLYM